MRDFQKELDFVLHLQQQQLLASLDLWLCLCSGDVMIAGKYLALVRHGDQTRPHLAGLQSKHVLVVSLGVATQRS